MSRGGGECWGFTVWKINPGFCCVLLFGSHMNWFGSWLNDYLRLIYCCFFPMSPVRRMLWLNIWNEKRNVRPSFGFYLIFVSFSTKGVFLRWYQCWFSSLLFFKDKEHVKNSWFKLFKANCSHLPFSICCVAYWYAASLPGRWNFRWWDWRKANVWPRWKVAVCQV